MSRPIWGNAAVSPSPLYYNGDGIFSEKYLGEQRFPSTTPLFSCFVLCSMCLNVVNVAHAVLLFCVPQPWIYSVFTFISRYTSCCCYFVFACVVTCARRTVVVQLRVSVFLQAVLE